MLKFIGSGDGFNECLGNNSAFIKENGVLFIIDCGETVFKRILELNLAEDVNEIIVLITHIHHDHFGSVHKLINHTNGIGINTTVIYPNPYLIAKILENKRVPKENYSLIRPEEFKDFNIEPILTRHHTSVEAYGYIIKKDIQAIYYSGDTCEVKPEIIEKLKNNEIQIIYHDACSYMEEDCGYYKYPHVSIVTLARMVPMHLRNKLWSMHINEGFNYDFARRLGFNVVENERQREVEKIRDNARNAEIDLDI